MQNDCMKHYLSIGFHILRCHWWISSKIVRITGDLRHMLLIMYAIHCLHHHQSCNNTLDWLDLRYVSIKSAVIFSKKSWWFLIQSFLIQFLALRIGKFINTYCSTEFTTAWNTCTQNPSTRLESTYAAIQVSNLAYVSINILFS